MGNVFGKLAGETAETILSGSHCDAIPKSGMYDGTVGVLGAIMAARTIKASVRIPALLCMWTDPAQTVDDAARSPGRLLRKLPWWRQATTMLPSYSSSAIQMLITSRIGCSGCKAEAIDRSSDVHIGGADSVWHQLCGQVRLRDVIIVRITFGTTPEPYMDADNDLADGVLRADDAGAKAYFACLL